MIMPMILIVAILSFVGCDVSNKEPTSSSSGAETTTDIDGGTTDIDGGTTDIDGGITDIDGSITDIDGSITDIDVGTTEYVVPIGSEPVSVVEQKLDSIESDNTSELDIDANEMLQTMKKMLLKAKSEGSFPYTPEKLKLIETTEIKNSSVVKNSQMSIMALNGNNPNTIISTYLVNLKTNPGLGEFSSAITGRLSIIYGHFDTSMLPEYILSLKDESGNRTVILDLSYIKAETLEAIAKAKKTLEKITPLSNSPYFANIVLYEHMLMIELPFSIPVGVDGKYNLFGKISGLIDLSGYPTVIETKVSLSEFIFDNIFVTQGDTVLSFPTSKSCRITSSIRPAYSKNNNCDNLDRLYGVIDLSIKQDENNNISYDGTTLITYNGLGPSIYVDLLSRGRMRLRLKPIIQIHMTDSDEWSIDYECFVKDTGSGRSSTIEGEGTFDPSDEDSLDAFVKMLINDNQSEFCGLVGWDVLLFYSSAIWMTATTGNFAYLNLANLANTQVFQNKGYSTIDKFDALIETVKNDIDYRVDHSGMQQEQVLILKYLLSTNEDKKLDYIQFLRDPRVNIPEEAYENVDICYINPSFSPFNFSKGVVGIADIDNRNTKSQFISNTPMKLIYGLSNDEFNFLPVLTINAVECSLNKTTTHPSFEQKSDGSVYLKQDIQPGSYLLNFDLISTTGEKVKDSVEVVIDPLSVVVTQIDANASWSNSKYPTVSAVGKIRSNAPIEKILPYLSGYLAIESNKPTYNKNFAFTKISEYEASFSVYRYPELWGPPHTGSKKYTLKPVVLLKGQVISSITKTGYWDNKSVKRWD